MVIVKFILNNHLIKHILDYKTVKLFDCLPKLKTNTLYSINCFYKHHNKYYTTDLLDMILFIYKDQYYLYQSNGFYLEKKYNYLMSKEFTYKLDIKELDDIFYNIILSCNKSIIIHTNDLINIYDEIDYRLRKYNYNIKNIGTDCRIIDDYLYPENILNDIYVNIENLEKKSFRKRIKEYLIKKISPFFNK